MHLRISMAVSRPRKISAFGLSIWREPINILNSPRNPFSSASTGGQIAGRRQFSRLLSVRVGLSGDQPHAGDGHAPPGTRRGAQDLLVFGFWFGCASIP
jgi:hypothetical protein